MKPRKKLPLKTKLASALLQMVKPDEEGRFVPVIPYEAAKTMTADQIIGHYQFDHGIHHALGGSDEPWNITPRPTKAHREKTAKIDIPAIAKTKRLSRVNEELQREVLAKPAGQKRRKRGKIPARKNPWPKSPRSMRKSG
jgi:hypothetical protein